MKKLFITIVAILLPLMASADAVEIAGIYYNLLTKGNVAEVTINPNYYKGDITIPDFVIYDNVTYNVIAIGASAFSNCMDLTSITLSNNVTSIGDQAFEYCNSLTSITFSTEITTIGSYAFES